MNDNQEDEKSTSLTSSVDATVSTQVTFKRRLLLLAVVSFVRLGMGMSYSLPTSFFAHETYRWKPHDEGSRYNGLMTGSASLFMVVADIFTAQVAIRQRSSKFLVCLSLFLLSGSTLLFGFVSYMAEFAEFFTFSLLLRMTTGFAQGMLDVASFAIGISTFPNRTGLVAGLLELTWGAGMALGAPAGGLLRDYGGFSLPFFLLAAIQGIQFITAVIFVRSLDKDNLKKNAAAAKVPRYPKSVLNILNAWVILTAIAGFISFLSLGYSQGALAPFAKSHLGLKPGAIGLLLLALSGCYLISTPITGKLTECIQGRWLIVFGLVVGAGGLMLMGFGNKLAVQIAAQVLLGIGVGVTLSASYVVLLEEPKKMGYDICEETSSVVYMVALVAQDVGETVGSAGGGPLATEFGFFSVCIGFASVIGCFSLVYFIASLVASTYRMGSYSLVEESSSCESPAQVQILVKEGYSLMPLGKSPLLGQPEGSVHEVTV